MSRHGEPAINFGGEGSRFVREFFVHNALYWIDEYRIDGLRLDAVHAIVDDSKPDIVTELSEVLRRHALRRGRHIHVVLENDRNEAHRLVRDVAGRPRFATAQWNDDIHHALHVLVTGERDGYYADYATRPLWQFGRCLAEGFAYQGEASRFRGGVTRGEPSGALPPGAFVSFAQTHDQVGNRAFGDRLVTLADARALRAVVACVLLSPSPPMLFMGEEFGATTPFLFFCDFGPGLAEAVARGRRAEFERFEQFRDPARRANIPDPNAASTFAASKLDWNRAGSEAGTEWLAFYRGCLDLRRKHVLPYLAGTTSGGCFDVAPEMFLRVHWILGGGVTLHLGAHFGHEDLAHVERLPGRPVYESDAGIAAGGGWRRFAVALSLDEGS